MSEVFQPRWGSNWPLTGFGSRASWESWPCPRWVSGCELRGRILPEPTFGGGRPKTRRGKGGKRRRCYGYCYKNRSQIIFPSISFHWNHMGNCVNPKKLRVKTLSFSGTKRGNQSCICEEAILALSTVSNSVFSVGSYLLVLRLKIWLQNLSI